MSMGQSKKNSDDKLYDDLRFIDGQMEFLNHLTLGRTPARNVRVLFQRADCKRCFFSVISGSEGKDSVSLSKGKYRIIFRTLKVANGENYDWLSPAQLRFIDVSGKKSEINFDIRFLMP
jgi:hypothetical protein